MKADMIGGFFYTIDFLNVMMWSHKLTQSLWNNFDFFKDQFGLILLVLNLTITQIR